MSDSPSALVVKVERPRDDGVVMALEALYRPIEQCGRSGIE